MHLIFFPNPRTCAVFAHWQCIARATKMEPLDSVSIFYLPPYAQKRKKHINMLLGSNPCPLALEVTAQFCPPDTNVKFDMVLLWLNVVFRSSNTRPSGTSTSATRRSSPAPPTRSTPSSRPSEAAATISTTRSWDQ